MPLARVKGVVVSEFFVVRRGATALRNEVVWDSSISFGALGILARALASAPGMHLGYRAFAGRGMGEKAVRAAMRELEAAGYRHRFGVRGAGGRLRTVTVFSDVAITREEALEEYVCAEDRARVVDRCPAMPAGEEDDRPGPVADGPGGDGPGSSGSNSGRESNTYPQDHSPASHRAAPPAARYPDPHDSNVNPESTVRRSTVARSTEARSTVPRWRTALSLRDTSTSSLRSEVTGNQTGPDRSARATRNDGPPPAGAAAVRSGPVREEPPGRRDGPSAGTTAARGASAPPAAGPPDRGGSSAPGGGPEGDVGDASERPSKIPGASERAAEPGGSDRFLRLVDECLPESMRVMDAAGARQVANLLEERLGAGWRPGEIRAVMDQRLPERVGRLSSLVASRLERNVVPGLAPSRGEGGGGADEEVERLEAAARRSEELAGTVRREPDPVECEMWERVRAEMPGASRLEQARAVVARVAERRRGVGEAM